MALIKAVTGESRSPNFILRNQARHPVDVLEFFAVEPNMTVAEIWPASGWWSEILAPYLKKDGLYYAVGYSLTAKRTPQWRKSSARELIQKFTDDPKNYAKVIVTSLSVPQDTIIAPPRSLDTVLTFRNVHNWMNGDYALEVFHAMFAALKHGGLLGVVEHRAEVGTDLDLMKLSGYVTEAYVISLAEAAGFELLAKSEINANRRDRKNHPAGVWTLPPSLRHCGTLKGKAESEQCMTKYRKIGESDRMTLKFIKPLITR